GSVGALYGGGRKMRVSAFRSLHPGSGKDFARLAARNLRCADWGKPIARGAGFAGSFAGGGAGCRQRGILALGWIVGSDHGPRGAKFEWTCDSLRRRNDGFHAARSG